MNLDSLSFALSEITYLVANLTKKTSKSSISEIKSLLSHFDAEAERHLYRCLFSYIDFNGDNKSAGKDFHQTQLLTQEFGNLLSKPNFVSLICYAIDSPLHLQKSLKPSAHLLPQISKTLKLSRIQEVVLGLALFESSSPDTRAHARTFVKQKLPDFIHAYVDPGQEEGVEDITVEVIHLLLVHLGQEPDQLGISAELKAAFLTALRKDFPEDRVPAIVRALIYPESEDISTNKLSDISGLPSSMMDSSLADMVLEVGYSFTQSNDDCKNMLSQFGVKELTPAAVARTLGMMAGSRMPSGEILPLQVIGLPSPNAASTWNDSKDKTDGNTPTTWNVEAFVEAVQDIAPQLNWRTTVEQMDNADFLIASKRGLSVIVTGLTKALDAFPVDLFYRNWVHHEGQMSFIVQALRNPDVFCFGEAVCRSVVIDILKTPPDEDNREISTWKSLDLVETLLRLSDLGHYQQVCELFNFPSQNCSDILLLALLQVAPSAWNRLKQELVSSLMPVFLGNHANSGAVLHYAWSHQGNSNTVRTLVMRAMAEWYMSGEAHDQTKLSRILDVAQDLKALSILLNSTPFAFVIDLGCLASRREFLKLDKWLADKIRDHKESFIQALIAFLKRRAPILFGTKDDATTSKSLQIPNDTLITILTCMRSCISQVSQELNDMMQMMMSNATIFLNKPIAPPAIPTPLPPPQPTNIAAPPPTGTTPISGMPTNIPPNLVAIAPNIGPLPPNLAGATTNVPLSIPQSIPQNIPPNLSGMMQNLGGLGPAATGAQQNIGSLMGVGLGGVSSSLGGLSGMAGNMTGNMAGNMPSNMVGNMVSNMAGNMASNMGVIGMGMASNIGSISANIGSMAQSITANMNMPQTLGGVTPSLPGVAPSLTPGLPNMPPTPINAMEAFGSIGPLGMGATVSSPYAQPNVSAIITPGSPAKPFQPVVSQANQGFGLQSLSAQMHNLNLQTPIPSGMPGRSPITLGNLSAQALKQQAPATAGTSVADMSAFFPEMSQQFSKDVEDEANSYFQRIYNHPPHATMSTDEVVEMLKKFRASPDKKERDVYACMLRSLLEEYRFFPQYPDKELQITAALFGSIIEQGLVTYMALGIALRYVLEALRKAYGSKMYNFGIAALDRFKTRLKDYPQYCQHLSAIAHFPQFPQHLIAYVEYGARSQEPNPSHAHVAARINTPPVVPSLPLNFGIQGLGLDTPIITTTAVTAVATAIAAAPVSVSTKIVPMAKPSIANATNIDTLLAGQQQGSQEEITVPPESIQDKVFFIFNNLSQSNMLQKAEDLKESVHEEHMSWVSQYMVMKRASIEPNFHTLYANFIDTLQIPNFTQMATAETFRNITVLLRSDKGVANFSDRALLKNLGHWLGMLTLAKNKPILQIDIDLKALLYEAYHKGPQELLYVVPFVAKVMESCAKSKVFRPPNPWTLRLMNVLAELHQEPSLKLNHKFEIEVLCKTLELDIRDLNPTNYLKDESRVALIEAQLSAPHKPFIIVPHIPLPPEHIAMPMLPKLPGPEGVVMTPPMPALPPQPMFTLDDINVASVGLLANLAVINENILFQAHPQLKQCVFAAIERSINDLPSVVIDRAVKIALTTCEQIVKKDFALDPEETRMRLAAHNMVRNMTAGLTLITCREPLLVSISTNLKTGFTNTLRGMSQPQKEMIEQTAQSISQDNVEMACAFVQKTAIEKAIPEMDKRLATEYEIRKHARSDGRRYCDTAVLTYQAERMPEQIRLRVGRVTQQQFAVYDEFSRVLPGFASSMLDTVNPVNLPKPQPLVSNQVPQLPPPPPPLPTAQPDFLPTVPDDMSEIYDKMIHDLKQHIQCMMTLSTTNPGLVQICGLLDGVIQARASRDPVSAIALIQKALEGLLDNFINLDTEITLRCKDCHVLVIKGLQDTRAYGPLWTNKHITRFLIELRDEKRYYVDGIDQLIRLHFINMQQYDQHLGQQLENGMNYMAISFTMQLIQRVCIDEKHNTDINETDFYNAIEALTRIASVSRQAPEGLTKLLETIRQNNEGLLDRIHGAPTTMMYSGISQARQFDDPPGLHEKTEYLLREWVNMYHMPAAGKDSTKAFSSFVEQMHQQGILKTDDLITRFFRLCTEMCVDLCYRALSEQSHSPTLVRAKCFHTLDAFVRLIALLVKHSGGTTNIITKVLGIVAGVLLQDHEVRQIEFQQLPYHRIFIMLFIELNAPEHILESINFQVLTAFCNTFHILRPTKAPGFAYALLELISHRVFIGRMLALTPQQRGWGMYAQLLIDLFKFLSPFLRNAKLSEPTQLLYKGTLRVLLVLLHDFPDFLSDFHYSFVDVIPPNCIQMRNLILSAFPRAMRLPDPFTPNLKVDMLADIAQAPRIMTNFANMIQPITFKKDLDSYLKTRAPVTYLSDLRTNLQSSEPGMRYNITLLNALVLYVGTQAITFIHSKGLTPSMSTIAHSSHMDIFQNLAVDLDTEGRYLFLNAIANQLRFPNSHTHYFSCTLLYLFVEANTEAIQEQITRVLLERLIVNRPHPWGLLITFIELIKNPQFKFWNHEFVHCAPEIEKLFESVARSCMQPKQNPREPDTAELH